MLPLAAVDCSENLLSMNHILTRLGEARSAVQPAGLTLLCWLHCCLKVFDLGLQAGQKDWVLACSGSNFAVWEALL